MGRMGWDMMGGSLVVPLGKGDDRRREKKRGGGVRWDGGVGGKL